MNVKIKRVDKSLPVPIYQTRGAVAFDLYSRIDLEIPPHKIERIPTNFVIEIPHGYMLEIKDRSSTMRRKGLFTSTGFIDQDFCGNNDEILLQVYNLTSETVKIEKGERLGQGAFVRVDQTEWTEVEEMTNADRGGFGTTGVK
ncbi:MAG TPA: dUTP diphosphatase [Candidatus Magasanikbacteria bacterium]|nr:dUTP diphosphatase [Candidatus Magasanikbacteria bacterium]